MSQDTVTKKLRILFIGTADFAVPSLEALVDSSEFEVVGLVTQPDKPVGRKQIMQGGPVKQWHNSKISEVNNLFGGEVKLFQPKRLKDDAEDILTQTKPDLVVVAAYGQMVPDNILNSPKYGALNIHGSLLPELRGAVPVQMAILKGLEKTGVTIQKMVSELDAGPVLREWEDDILLHDTTETLMKRLADKGAELLIHTIPGWVAGEIKARNQNQKFASYCWQSDIAKDKAEITYETPVLVAERMVRAFYPWPIAWFQLGAEQKRVKIYTSEVSDVSAAELELTGRLAIHRMDKTLLLELNDGLLQLNELQLEGKQQRPAAEYLFLADS